MLRQLSLPNIDQSRSCSVINTATVKSSKRKAVPSIAAKFLGAAFGQPFIYHLRP
jgi:hypothetical protein